MIPPLFGKQEVGIWRVKKRFPRYRVPIWSLWPNIRSLPSIVAEKNVHICSMWFFSATIDGRNLIFGHKLHIGTLYRGKRFLTRQIPPKQYVKIAKNQIQNLQIKNKEVYKILLESQVKEKPIAYTKWEKCLRKTECIH
jgi:hypothetical protein